MYQSWSILGIMGTNEDMYEEQRTIVTEAEEIRQGRGLGRLSLSGPFVEQLTEERVRRTMDFSGDSRIANVPQLPQSGNVQGYARICQETSIILQHAAQL